MKANSEDVVTFLNAELSTDVKTEFPYVGVQEFDNERRNIEAGMLRGAVHLNLRDRNADAIAYGRQRIWPEPSAKPRHHPSPA